MIKWFLVGVLGAIVTVARNGMFKGYGLEWALNSKVMWLGLVASVLMMYIWGMWFSTAPSFFLAWFIGNALLVIAGFVVTSLVFGEAICLLNILGVALIFVGSYLLMVKP
ncbi:MAG: hypothetical protein GWN17_09890 [Candidatus Korarchaeota archaeon]|nr:hypothetical protein [Candidatus Korarchaeota archaeon]